MASSFTALVIVTTACAAFVLAFTGIYRDREWDEPHLFVKHRPSARFVYFSPTGEGDRAPRPDERDDEEAYREFVEAHRGYARSLPLPFAPPWRR